MFSKSKALITPGPRPLERIKNIRWFHPTTPDKKARTVAHRAVGAFRIKAGVVFRPLRTEADWLDARLAAGSAAQDACVAAAKDAAGDVAWLTAAKAAGLPAEEVARLAAEKAAQQAASEAAWEAAKEVARSAAEVAAVEAARLAGGSEAEKSERFMPALTTLASWAADQYARWEVVPEIRQRYRVNPFALLFDLWELGYCVFGFADRHFVLYYVPKDDL